MSISAEIERRLSSHGALEVRRAVESLVAEGRIERRSDDRLGPGRRYAVLSSAQFRHRIDALNHFLAAVDRAVTERLVEDNRRTAMIKTISFSASADELVASLARFEGDLRREVSVLEESAVFAGREGERYTFALLLAPLRGALGDGGPDPIDHRGDDRGP
jgi:hypothetical protein